MAKLGEIFRANVGYNPTHGNGTNGFHPSLARQLKGLRNEDPGEQQQKALPVCVLKTTKISSPVQKYIIQLGHHSGRHPNTSLFLLHAVM
jgi:hypothetical protein